MARENRGRMAWLFLCIGIIPAFLLAVTGAVFLALSLACLIPSFIVSPQGNLLDPDVIRGRRPPL